MLEDEMCSLPSLESLKITVALMAWSHGCPSKALTTVYLSDELINQKSRQEIDILYCLLSEKDYQFQNLLKMQTIF